MRTVNCIKCIIGHSYVHWNGCWVCGLPEFRDKSLQGTSARESSFSSPFIFEWLLYVFDIYICEMPPNVTVDAGAVYACYFKAED
jgi:hypothetical protein